MHAMEEEHPINLLAGSRDSHNSTHHPFRHKKTTNFKMNIGSQEGQLWDKLSSKLHLTEMLPIDCHFPVLIAVNCISCTECNPLAVAKTSHFPLFMVREACKKKQPLDKYLIHYIYFTFEWKYLHWHEQTKRSFS